MANEDVELEQIQNIFSETNSKKTESSEKSNLIFVDIKKELKDNPMYDNMHAKNIKITKKGYESTQKSNLSLKVCVAVIGKIATNFLPSSIKESNDVTKSNIGISNIEETNEKDLEPSVNEILDLSNGNNILKDYDFSNVDFVLKETTTNVEKIVATIERELNDLNISNKVVYSNENIVDILKNFHNNDENKKIVIINIDGVNNDKINTSVIVTNYNNDSKSADGLALGIQNSNNAYGIMSEIKCGMLNEKGKRTSTELEKNLESENCKNIICITIIPTAKYMLEEIEINNFAISIVDGIIRWGTLNEKEKYDNFIHRVEQNDNVKILAEENGTSMEYITKQNAKTFSQNNGLLREDDSLIVKELPKKLTEPVKFYISATTNN